MAKLHLEVDAQTLETRAWKRPTIAPAMPRCCRNCYPRLRRGGTGNGDDGWGIRYAPVSRRDCGARDSCHHSPRRNGQFWKGSSRGNRARNESLRTVKHLGQRCGESGVATIGTAWSKRRGTASNCWQTCVTSRDFGRQVTELQICAAMLNRFTALGTPQTALRR